ncbi:hypothetical protein Esti_001995 [Eimeria stiedai]
MTMLVCILEKEKVYHLATNWASSLFGNWLGALFVAYFLSYLTGALDSPHLRFRQLLPESPGMHTFVCLALWFDAATDDGAGKIMALWFPILAFYVGGYGYIIADFYTLQATLIAGAPISVGNVVVRTFILTPLGNLVSCCLFLLLRPLRGSLALSFLTYSHEREKTCMWEVVAWWVAFYPMAIARGHVHCGSGGSAVQPLEENAGIDLEALGQSRNSYDASFTEALGAVDGGEGGRLPRQKKGPPISLKPVRDQEAFSCRGRGPPWCSGSSRAE